MLSLKSLPFVLILLAAFGLAALAADTSKPPIPLDLNDKKTQRLEVSQSQIGFTSTKVFYTLHDPRVVVVIHIDNAKQGFPVTGNVCRFAKDATPEGIAKWLNNQHSDALFADAPQPEETVKLPADACHSLESKLIGQKTVNDTTYNHYKVAFKLSEVKATEQFRLLEHKDAANVYVVAK